MTRAPGRVWLTPHDLDAWIRQLAALLPTLHAGSADVGRASLETSIALAVPASARRPEVWTAAKNRDRRRSGRRARRCSSTATISTSTCCGRVVASARSSTGAGSWIASPDLDVGHCRLNLAVLSSAEVAERFRHAYEVRGRPTRRAVVGRPSAARLQRQLAGLHPGPGRRPRPGRRPWHDRPRRGAARHGARTTLAALEGGRPIRARGRVGRERRRASPGERRRSVGSGARSRQRRGLERRPWPCRTGSPRAPGSAGPRVSVRTTVAAGIVSRGSALRTQSSPPSWQFTLDVEVEAFGARVDVRGRVEAMAVPCVGAVVVVRVVTVEQPAITQVSVERELVLIEDRQVHVDVFARLAPQPGIDPQPPHSAHSFPNPAMSAATRVRSSRWLPEVQADQSSSVKRPIRGSLASA